MNIKYLGYGRTDKTIIGSDTGLQSIKGEYHMFSIIGCVAAGTTVAGLVALIVFAFYAVAVSSIAQIGPWGTAAIFTGSIVVTIAAVYSFLNR